MKNEFQPCEEQKAIMEDMGFTQSEHSSYGYGYVEWVINNSLDGFLSIGLMHDMEPTYKDVVERVGQTMYERGKRQIRDSIKEILHI